MRNFENAWKAKTKAHCFYRYNASLFSCLQPHCPIANSGIVLQAGTVMVHLVLSLRKKKVPSLFYSAVCLETSKRNWKLEWLKGLHSGCYTEGLYGGTAHLLGGSPLEAVPWWGNATGLGRAKDPKVGHSPDFGGSTCDNKTRRGFFCNMWCQGRRKGFSFASFAANQKK